MQPTSAPSFVHLRMHSEFSVVDGIVRIDDAVAAAAADRMPALALTDLSNVFGMVKFYKAAREAGIKPVIGCDVWLTNEADRDKPYRLLLLAQNHAGYLKLCHLLTQAYRTNQYRGRAEIRSGWFSETGTDGLIALSGAHHGDIGQALIADNAKAAAVLARGWAKRFPGRFYIEVQRPGPRDDRGGGRGAGRNLRAAHAETGGTGEIAGGRYAPGAVFARRRLSRARGTRLHSGRLHAVGPAPSAALH
jgi:DNA polymerase III subunit alpha